MDDFSHFTALRVEEREDRVHARMDRPGVRNAIKFFDWALNKGDDIARRMGTAPLPDQVNKAVREAWGVVKGPDGKQLWTG